MVTPLFLLVLLPLVHSNLVKVEFESGVPADQQFTAEIVPGFVATTFTCISGTFEVCKTPLVVPCYEQAVTSKVTFAVADKTKTPKIKFSDGTNPDKIVEIAQLETPATKESENAQSNAFTKTDYELPFKPTKMTLLKEDGTSPVGDPLDPTPEDQTCPATSGTAAGCFKPGDALNRVKVTAKVAADNLVVTLGIPNTNELKATFKPLKVCSEQPNTTSAAVAVMSRSYAAILASLLLLFFFH